MVMATQNPIEQEGTYPLPEAQLDRFLMHVFIDYPNAKVENDILELAHKQALEEMDVPVVPSLILSNSDVATAQREVLNIHMAAPVQEYLVQLVLASRNPMAYSEKLASWVSYGGSSRATIALDRCARAHAWLHQRDYVSPEDVQAVTYEVLRHRILISYEAEAEGITTDDFIGQLIQLVPVA
jgi:MoxR-like ATPase